MEKRFKIIATNFKWVTDSANYHLSHGDYKIVKIDTGRVFWVGPKYLCITMECPDVTIELNKRRQLQEAVDAQDFIRAAKLRDELNNNR